MTVSSRTKAHGLHSARFLFSLTSVRNFATVTVSRVDDQQSRNVALSKFVVATEGWAHDIAQPDDHGLDAYPPRHGGERVAQDGGLPRRTGQGRDRPDHHRRLRAEYRGPDRARWADTHRARAGAGIATRHRSGSPAWRQDLPADPAFRSLCAPAGMSRSVRHSFAHQQVSAA